MSVLISRAIISAINQPPAHSSQIYFVFLLLSLPREMQRQSYFAKRSLSISRLMFLEQRTIPRRHPCLPFRGNREANKPGNVRPGRSYEREKRGCEARQRANLVSRLERRSTLESRERETLDTKMESAAWALSSSGPLAIAIHSFIGATSHRIYARMCIRLSAGASAAICIIRMYNTYMHERRGNECQPPGA